MPQASDVIEAFEPVTGDLVWSHQRNLPDDVYDFVGGNSWLHQQRAATLSLATTGIVPRPVDLLM